LERKRWQEGFECFVMGQKYRIFGQDALPDRIKPVILGLNGEKIKNTCQRIKTGLKQD
jgi:hypothetical protein